ncbi:MAG: 50S ribosomal protein L7/L12 [Patescibacteria group bacterium]|nr:50S ribosomal protein L7/L12 [Patescibacteria group bacterium]
MAEEKETVEIPAKFEKLVKEIEQMSVLDLAELVKILEKKFGVSAAAPVAMAAPAGSAAPAGEEKTSFTVVLAGPGDKKIDVIKVIRDITALGLKEAKDMVDNSANSAQVVKENVKKEEAEEMKKKLEAAGAKVEMK